MTMKYNDGHMCLGLALAQNVVGLNPVSGPQSPLLSTIGVIHEAGDVDLIELLGLASGCVMHEAGDGDRI